MDLGEVEVLGGEPVWAAAAHEEQAASICEHQNGGAVLELGAVGRKPQVHESDKNQKHRLGRGSTRARSKLGQIHYTQQPTALPALGVYHLEPMVV